MDWGAGGEGLDGCPGLKLIAAFVQQDFQIEAFDNKEPTLPFSPTPSLSVSPSPFILPLHPSGLSG